jgi:glycosyltransferase involved in cell wall biosynthesis
VTDYSDQFYPSEFALKCIEPAHYFQLNVPRDLVGTCLGPAQTRIHYLPTVIQDELIDSLRDQSPEARNYDIFVAGTYHNEQRVKQLDSSRILSGRGWKIYELGEKSFGKFTAGILDSLLCFAGKGLAYHCFRPLEAAAAGAAPVSHWPEEGTYHDYVHGENCFLYDPSLSPLEIAEFVESILKDPQLVPKVVSAARELLDSKHRASSLAKNLLSTLQQS